MSPAPTLRAIRDKIDALAKTFGPKCEIWVTLDNHSSGPPLSAAIKPQGLTGPYGTSLRVTAETWDELFENLREKWAAHADTHTKNLIREMALEIISQTADHGDCTAAALRAKFDPADVKALGARACAEATEIAGLAPFTILETPLSNAVAA